MRTKLPSPCMEMLGVLRCQCLAARYRFILILLLYIYCVQVIGIREGSLDIHGKYVPVTWTHLATTASPGDTTIELKQPVTWAVGDHIAIATTGDRNSQKENEENYIDAISGDGRTVTLRTPLKYQHISIEQTFGDQVVETRGEVALLTRNVLVQGTMNEQFVEVLPACDQEFNSGGAFSDAMQVPSLKNSITSFCLVDLLCWQVWRGAWQR